MINKRFLVKNLLAHNDENSFVILQLNLGNKEGKAKFLKHICALSNSNPKNNSYIKAGIMDHENEIVGVDFLMMPSYKTLSMPISTTHLSYFMKISTSPICLKEKWLV